MSKFIHCFLPLILCSVFCWNGFGEQPELFVTVLGVAQDAGYPQSGCKKECCKLAWEDFNERKFVSCVALVDRTSNQFFMFDCTPDFRDQFALLQQIANLKSKTVVDGIFLTHAHIGHYTGLMQLGHEVMGTSNVPVYGTERMANFLTNNGPWSQLVSFKNIKLNELVADTPIQINPRIKITPFKVPHRDEFSDTVGFKIESKSKSLVYLPDIDKWSKWNRSVESVVEKCDFALLDGSFFADGEIPGRDMASIQHPFIQESIKRFSSLEKDVRKRIKFIHLNHTNPAIRLNGDPAKNSAARQIYEAGMGLAKQGEIISLD